MDLGSFLADTSESSDERSEDGKRGREAVKEKWRGTGSSGLCGDA